MTFGCVIPRLELPLMLARDYPSSAHLLPPARLEAATRSHNTQLVVCLCDGIFSIMTMPVSDIAHAKIVQRELFQNVDNHVWNIFLACKIELGEPLADVTCRELPEDFRF